MSRVSQLASTVKDFFSGFLSDPGIMTVKELRSENEILTKQLRRLSTPAPDVDLLNQNLGPEIRMPRVPIAEFQFYTLRWASVALRTVCLKVKQEIFRETSKDGWDWEPAFKQKCQVCGAEFDERVDTCTQCNAAELRGPDPSQKKIWLDFMKEANGAEQTGLEVFQELEDDLNTIDDSYLILIKDYMINPEGDQLWGKVTDIMRGDPAKFRIVANDAGIRGGKYFVCPYHRQVVSNSPGSCTVATCQKRLHDVHYVETEGGGTDPKPLKYFIKGEVIHASKYEPSRLYGISPIYTLWVLARTLMLMDKYAENLYEKGRLKGVLGIGTDNMEYVKKWWDETQQRLRQDPHYLPVVAIESGEKGKGKMEFVKLIDSLKELEYEPSKRFIREQMCGLFGVSPIFQADVSTGGGLNNEGLQVTVTDRTVDFGQAIHHDKFFPKLCEALGVTDWMPKLKPSREQDEMAELQQFDQKVQTAEKMRMMGYKQKLLEDGFKFYGEASDYQEPSAGGFGDFGGEQEDGDTESPEGPEKPEPPNRMGIKECPPGMIATPENPRCHPIEWESKQAMATDLAKFGIPWGVIKRICRMAGMVEEEKAEFQKSGDMLAHYACMGNKIKNLGYNIPADKSRGKAYADYVQELKRKDPRVREAWNACDKAGVIGSTPDPDYPDPPGYNKADNKAEYFDMIRNEDESGVSGTGTVGSGIVFPDGQVVFRWQGEKSSTNVYDSLKDFNAVHVDPHPGNKTEFRWYDVESRSKNDQESIERIHKAIESGRKLDQAQDKIESRFMRQITEAYMKKLRKMDQFQDANKKSLKSQIDKLLRAMQPDLERIAFQEVLRAYRKGKAMVKDGITKADAPREIDWESLPFSKDDVQVLRGIYQENPFWESFANMSLSLSDKLKEHIRESYEAPTSARFKATLRDVKRQYPDRSLDSQMNIAYGRIGKMNLGKVIEKMRRTIATEAYRLERIARSETTAVTAKGREIALTERDPAGNYRYDWFGPMDHRTSDQCKEIEKRVKKAGKGKGVPITQLKQIMKEVVEEFNQTRKTGWNYRDWLPHANCRRVLRRVQ